MEIFTLNTVAAATSNGHRRNHCQVVKQTLTELWQLGCIVRINNFGDKENAAHSAKDIKNQVSDNFDILKLPFLFRIYFLLK